MGMAPSGTSPCDLETDSPGERARMKECLEHRLMYLPG